MQIDWLTVAAQIVNFLILVWLLQRFLYKPITEAMRRREERIENRLSEARAARRQAEEEAEALKRRQEELNDRKEDILASAHEEARAMRDRLEDEVRREVEEKRAAWRAHLAGEQAALVSSLQRHAGRRVLDITGRILSEYTGSGISERMVATFAEHLTGLDADTRDRLAGAAAEAQTAVVETGAALDGPAKGRITRALRAALGADIDVDYRVDDQIVMGARLTIGDVTAEWSAARYLDRLRAELDEVIDAGSHGGGPAPDDGAEPQARAPA